MPVPPRTLLLLLACCSITGNTLASQSLPPIGAADRARLVEVVRLATAARARIWPGWEHTPLAILLVTDSVEYLLGHPRPSPDFGSVGEALLGMEIRARPRVFAPTLLATFPAVGGFPTIVVGTAEHTGKSSGDWVLTLLHEHFHQWQYSLPDYYRRVDSLDLSGGDSTGMWMLTYPFPYESAGVQKAATRFAQAVSTALSASRGRRARALSAVIEARTALGRLLTPAENRYLEFQLWQEGVARFIEYKAAGVAATGGQPSPAFRALPDYEPYAMRTRRRRLELQRDLNELNIGRDRRTSFYSLGAGLGLLLDMHRPEWKRGYETAPFQMTSYLPAD